MACGHLHPTVILLSTDKLHILGTEYGRQKNACKSVDHCTGLQVNVPRRPRKDYCEGVVNARETPATGEAILVLTGVKGASPGSAPSGFGP
jgi:hypothetical protein